MGGKILIIDDDETNNAMAARFLESRGHEVVTTESAFNTAALVTETAPDLVLVDVRMPGLTGDTLIRMAKRREGGTRCPFVLYSTADVDELQRLAEDSGADGYIQKSGRLGELARRIEDFIAQR